MNGNAYCFECNRNEPQPLPLQPWPPFGNGGYAGSGRFTVLGAFPSLGALQAAHPTGNPGDAYLINGDAWVWTESTNSWENGGPIQGPQGPQGNPGTNGTNGLDAAITGVTIVTGAAGTAASVTMGGTPQARTFEFTIPRGDPGDPGEGLTVGSATPPPNPDPGDLWTTINGEAFIWLGTAWRQLG